MPLVYDILDTSNCISFCHIRGVLNVLEQLRSVCLISNEAISSHIKPHLAILSLSTENCWCPSDWAKPPGASLFDRRCCQCKYRRHRILLSRACWSSQICMACWIEVHQRLKSYHKRSQAFTTWGLCPWTISFLLANHMYKLSNHWTCIQHILIQNEIATW